MGERRLRLLCAVAVVAGALLLSAVPAFAHATLVAATPSPGTGLPQAPGAVIIRFTEPLNPRLSRIEVLDENGRDVGAGKTTPVGDGATALRRRLPLLAPGRFTVRWTTVSTLDGHMRRGSYVFGVGTTASAAQRLVDGPLESEGWPGLVGRFVALGGLGSWAGAGLVGERAGRAGLGHRRLVALAVGAPTLALVGTAVSLVSAAVVAGGSAASILDAVGASQSGQFRVMGMLAAAVGLGSARRAPSPTGGRPLPPWERRRPPATRRRGLFPSWPPCRSPPTSWRRACGPSASSPPWRQPPVPARCWPPSRPSPWRRPPSSW